jgi:hypothetical protein
MESFAEVRYGDLILDRRSKVARSAAGTFVAIAEPMPVGTALELRLDSGEITSVLVRRVVEQAGGGESPGMWVVGAEAVPILEVEPGRRMTQHFAAATVADVVGSAQRLEGAVEVLSRPPQDDAAAYPVVDDGKRTQVLTVDPSLLAEAAATLADAPADAESTDGGKGKKNKRKNKRG